VEQLVLTERDGNLCTISLNRPASLNAINHEMFRQLKVVVEELGRCTDDVACVIIKGNGRAFSAGYDLKAVADLGLTAFADHEAETLEALSELPMPVIAQVHGYCFTGALEVALAADFVFVDEATVLADTHAKWGLSPVCGMSQRLPRRVGIAHAKDLRFSCREVAGAEALSMGLVDRVYTTDNLEAETLEFAQQIAANSAQSIRIQKMMLQVTDGLRINDGLDYEYTNSPGSCEDASERISQFLKNR
jgi:enoyl-CoA hydratase/carnithine racemase